MEAADDDRWTSAAPSTMARTWEARRLRPDRLGDRPTLPVGCACWLGRLTRLSVLRNAPRSRSGSLNARRWQELGENLEVVVLRPYRQIVGERRRRDDRVHRTCAPARCLRNCQQFASRSATASSYRDATNDRARSSVASRSILSRPCCARRTPTISSVSVATEMRAMWSKPCCWRPGALGRWPGAGDLQELDLWADSPISRGRIGALTALEAAALLPHQTSRKRSGRSWSGGQRS